MERTASLWGEPSAPNPVVSELEPHLQLQVAQRLRARRRAEPGGSRRQAILIERAVRQVLRVDDRQIGRAPVDHVALAVVVDHGVERVEDVEAELNVAVSAETN